MVESELSSKRWLLPSGIEEILPPEAQKLEVIRRQLLDCYRLWGYDYVITPMMEYIESMQAGEDLDLQTLKVIDALNGRLMGIRTDITPQVARIDAHLLNQDTPVRLCYWGTVLRAYADTLGGSRSPLQIGAELYGHAGVDSVIEIIDLMLETMDLVGAQDYYLDLGHVSIFKSLAQQAQLGQTDQSALFDALQRKDSAKLQALAQQWMLPKKIHEQFMTLLKLNGDRQVLQQAKKQFADAAEEVTKALLELEQIADKINQCRPKVSIHFDLSELRGFNYHSGVVFAVYMANYGQEIARGGRYDGIGEVFGRSRSATGFSTDLRTLVEISDKSLEEKQQHNLVFAPARLSPAHLDQGLDEESLSAKVQALRNAGQRVVRELTEQVGDAAAMGCSHVLIAENGKWIVQPIETLSAKSNL